VLTLLGADGIGRKEVPLPEDADTGYCFSCIISPDGEWLAFWTGTAGEYPDNNPLTSGGPFDLQLNLLHIPDGAVQTITGLLSEDYPENFQKNAEALKNLPEYVGWDIESIAADLSMSFSYGIQSAAWSPDSRYLAFAGEMDGPSSDLYVFDTSRQSIRRLSDGPKNILAVGYQSIYWSPDGKWIVYSSGYEVGAGMSVSFYAARPDGSAFREFPGEVEGMNGWFSSSAFFLYRSANGIGGYGDTVADLNTGGKKSVWVCPFKHWDVDSGRGDFLIYQYYGGPEWPGCEISGLFLKNLYTGKKQLLAEIECEGDCYESRVWFLGRENRINLFYQHEVGTHVVSAGGELTLIWDADVVPVPSPDREWAIFAGVGLSLMDSALEFTDLQSGQKTSTVNWRPDSKGFLFDMKGELYFVSLPDGTMERLAKDFASVDPYFSYWQPDSEGYYFVSESDLYFLSLRNRSLERIQRLQDERFIDPVWVAVPE
jgi:hypothetical protein